jgi:CubicO group peptidase (beta-lactamase class C family)
MIRVLVIVVALALVVPPGAQTRAGRAPAYQRPPTIDDGWQTAAADSLGVDTRKLGTLTESIRAWPELGVHAVLIERGGRLMYEEYFDGFDERWGEHLGRVSISRESLHDLRSVTKSVVSALVGIAVDSGAIRSLNQSVIDWFPEYADLNTDERRRRVTLAHVLGMTAGLDWNEDVPYTDPRNDEIRMTADQQPLRYVLSRPFVHDPGDEFTYNGGLTQIMAVAVSRATKTSLVDYARKMLFDPLGIREFEWLGDVGGVPSAASGLRLRPRDLANSGRCTCAAGGGTASK